MDDIVWESNLDEIYACSVIRIAPYFGKLTVKNTQNGEYLLDKEVGLSYDAHFGPDIENVTYWEDLCIEAVDNAT